MNIKFEKIHIENFMSLSNVDVALANSGYTLVSGRNNCDTDSAYSNGSGKSSIWEAISWCLTGSTIRGSKDVVNMNTQGGCLVCLEFCIDNNKFVVTRTKDHSKFKTNLFVSVNGDDKSGKGIRDTEKILQSLLPDLTSSLIGSVIILGQGLPQRFSNNTPSGRKEVLEKLSKSDFMIEDLKNRVACRKSELSRKLRDIEDALCAYNAQISTYETNKRFSEKELESLGSVDYYRDKLLSAKESLVSIEESLEKGEAEYRDKENQVRGLREEYVLLDRQRVDEVAKSDLVFDDELKHVSDTFNEIIQKLRERKVEIESDIKHTRSKIAEMDSVQDTCPTCGRKYDGIVKPDTTALKSSVSDMSASLSSVISEINEKTKDYQGKQSEITRNKELNRNKINDEIFGERLSFIEKSGKQLNTEMTSLSNSMCSLKDSRKSISDDISHITGIIVEFDFKKKSCEENIAHCTSKISELEEKIKYNITEKENIQAHIDVVNKFSTYITRDFRGYLLSNVISYIDLKSKEYALDVFRCQDISFTLNGNNIDIIYCGKDYENLSGGERQKVDLIVQFSLRDMLCKFLNFGSNILVVDEIFDNLDSVGCKNVLNMISNRLCDIDSIYIVTHHSADLDIPYDSEIIVVKDNTGVSTINVV